MYNKFKLKFSFIAHVGVTIGVVGFINTHTQRLCAIESKDDEGQYFHLAELRSDNC